MKKPRTCLARGFRAVWGRLLAVHTVAFSISLHGPFDTFPTVCGVLDDGVVAVAVRLRLVVVVAAAIEYGNYLLDGFCFDKHNIGSLEFDLVGLRCPSLLIQM